MRGKYLCGLTAVALFGAAGCAGDLNPVASPSEQFEAALSGANEVPPVTTTAAGTATFWILEDSFLVYRLEVAAVDSPTAAHIHEGAAGVNGAVIVTLYTRPTAASSRPGLTTGPLRVGQFKPSQLTQVPSGYGATPQERFDSLLRMMRAGTVYVNAHTVRFGGGEIRGQVQLR